MTEVSLEAVVGYGDAMLQMPRSALTIFEMALNDETEVDDLVSVIQVDPTFTARLLQQVNSPVYSRGVEVTSIGQAVNRLGREQIAQIAAVLATTAEIRKLECDLLKSSGYWRHSLTVGAIAREIGRARGLDTEPLFIAGLLHDLGKPIEFHMLGDAMMDVLEMSLMNDEPDIASAETEVLGFSHCEVGARMAERWNLPLIVLEAIRFHHAPRLAENYPDEVAVVALANAIEHIEIDEGYQDISALEGVMAGLDASYAIELEDALAFRELGITEAAKLWGE